MQVDCFGWIKSYSEHRTSLLNYCVISQWSMFTDGIFVTKLVNHQSWKQKLCLEIIANSWLFLKRNNTHNIWKWNKLQVSDGLVLAFSHLVLHETKCITKTQEYILIISKCVTTDYLYQSDSCSCTRYHGMHGLSAVSSVSSVSGCFEVWRK